MDEASKEAYDKLADSIKKMMVEKNQTERTRLGFDAVSALYALINCLASLPGKQEKASHEN